MKLRFLQTSRVPLLVIQRFICQTCDREGQECRDHQGIDLACELGRAWAEQEVDHVTELGLAPAGPWFGSREAAWRRLTEAGAPQRATLIDVIYESARTRWTELVPPALEASA